MNIEIELPNRQTVKLTEDEARKLRDDLNRLFGAPAVPVYIERYPSLPTYPHLPIVTWTSDRTVCQT